jgi:hypothetical protein
MKTQGKSGQGFQLNQTLGGSVKCDKRREKTGAVLAYGDAALRRQIIESSWRMAGG